MNSSWELTKQRSTYHFDNFRLDPDVDKVTFLGNILPFWKQGESRASAHLLT